MCDELVARQSELERQCRELVAQKTELTRWLAEAGAERLRVEQERSAAERIGSLDRLYLALSQTNQAILRIRTAEGLFRRICDISAEFGEFPLTWIGMEAADRRELDVVAKAGPETGIMEGLRISTDPASPWGRGPAATAAREDRLVIVEEYRNDPGTVNLQALADRHGLKANAALPLRKSGRAVGVLSVYSDQVGFFDPEKVALLGEIADGLGYALESIDREAQLRQERAFTRALLDNMGEGVVACDGEGRLVLSNRTFHLWHGEEAPSQSLEDYTSRPVLFEPDGTTPLPVGSFPLNRVLRGEVFQDAAVTLCVPGQPPRHLLVNGSPILDPRGLALGAVAVLHDVTRQRRADALLRTISVAVEQSPVSVLITDARGSIEYVNPKFSELTGYSAAESLGRNPSILREEEYSPSHYQQLWETIAGGRTWKGEFHNRKKNGDLFWEAATIAPIKDPGGRITHYVAIKEDITEFKRVEQERRESQARLLELHADLERRVLERTALLERANEELDAFSYSVSHDLRAPLRGIDGFSQALLEECGAQLGADGRHYLERVRAGVLRMGNLIDDLLRLSRVGRAPLTESPMDLSAMARAILEDRLQKLPARALTYRVEEALTARGDPGLIQVVLDNLLGNAVKYSAHAPAASIEFSRTATPEGPAFCVRDNGAGFDMAYANKLFKAFQRLHSPADFEGSGIGLAIVQRIIHRHGGRVWAEAQPGQGASFYFTLP